MTENSKSEPVETQETQTRYFFAQQEEFEKAKETVPASDAHFRSFFAALSAAFIGKGSSLVKPLNTFNISVSPFTMIDEKAEGEEQKVPGTRFEITFSGGEVQLKAFNEKLASLTKNRRVGIFELDEDGKVISKSQAMGMS